MALGLGQHVIDNLEVPATREQMASRLWNGMLARSSARRGSRHGEHENVLGVVDGDRKADGVVLEYSPDYLGDPREHIANIKRAHQGRQ